MLRYRNLCCDTYFLSQSKFFFNLCRDLILFCCDNILLFHSFYYRDINFLCRDRDSAFNSSLCCNMNFFVFTPLVFLFSSLSPKKSVDLCCSLSIFYRDIIVFCHDRVHLLVFRFLCCDRGNIVETQLLCSLP